MLASSDGVARNPKGILWSDVARETGDNPPPRGYPAVKDGHKETKTERKYGRRRFREGRNGDGRAQARNAASGGSGKKKATSRNQAIGLAQARRDE